VPGESVDPDDENTNEGCCGSELNKDILTKS